jgi:hypothetical protein
LYLSTTLSVVSGALVIEKEILQVDAMAKQQYPVYFVSEVLAGSTKYYSKVETICYVVIMIARKLQHYFEAHTIRVITNQPLHNIFSNRGNSGRIGKWAIELSEHVVNFEKHSTIKLHILADFVAKWTKPQSQPDIVQESPWLVYCDGA